MSRDDMLMVSGLRKGEAYAWKFFIPEIEINGYYDIEDYNEIDLKDRILAVTARAQFIGNSVLDLLNRIEQLRDAGESRIWSGRDVTDKQWLAMAEEVYVTQQPEYLGKVGDLQKSIPMLEGQGLVNDCPRCINHGMPGIKQAKVYLTPQFPAVIIDTSSIKKY